ncbi:MAG TPA: hypothetical protein PKY82_26700 [Pyrinomonadaceae bacterium]|nr:hypothetical protein [Pyrinomonadaceae bacterium]
MVLNNNGMGWWESKQTWLMKTTDGGKSWNITKTAYKTIYQEIFFFDENNGWMIGNEYSLEPTVTVKPLVYKTADGGDNWTETSEQLRNLMGIHDGNGHIGNLLIENRKKLKVTNKYKIFESNDEGKSWHNYGIDFSFLRDQNAIGNLGKIEQTNRIKAAQGGLTVEGSYVYLATEETDGTWINREIKEPINLSNVIFFTDKDAFLFGTRLEGSLQEDRDNMKGVIYYSSDGGATFSKIYETQKTLGFSDIHKITDKKFFVIGAEGLVLNIEF